MAETRLEGTPTISSPTMETTTQRNHNTTTTTATGGTNSAATTTSGNAVLNSNNAQHQMRAERQDPNQYEIERDLQMRMQTNFDTPTEIEIEPTNPGWIFHWFNARDPLKARRRFGTLYWKAWSRLLMAFFLLMFGLTFVVIGLLCMKMCDDFDRGIAFFCIGLLMALPGGYGTAVLVNYVRGKQGFSYEQLPELQ